MQLLEIEKLIARNGQDTLRVTLNDGRSVYLHSSYDPGREAESWAQEIQYERGKTIVLFGLGLGYHLSALISRFGRDVHILVVEPSSQIRELAENIPEIASLLKHDNVRVCHDWSTFRDTFTESEGSWQETSVLKVPSYQQAFQEEYRSFLSKLHGQINSVLGNLCTLVTSSQSWQENCLRNLKYLDESPPVAAAFDQFSGKPLIIVSAGPSLSKNINVLASAKGRAFILAVGTVNRLLTSKGIIPDLIASFDGMEGNYRHHFMDLQNTESCLLYDPAVHHLVVSKYLGPKCLMLINPSNEWIEDYTETEIGQVRIGPSISNTVFDLACKLGADPIIFVGQDLAFTNDSTHAEGTHLKGVRGFDYSISNPIHRFSQAGDSQERRSLRKLVWVEGLNGEKVQTDSKMLSYLHWFEERIEALAGSRTIINATEGGAIIRGTQAFSLKETVDRFCTEDISESIQHIHRLLTQKPQYNLFNLVTYLKKVRSSAKRLASHCKRGARLTQTLKEHHEGTRTCNLENTLAKLHQIDQTLVRQEEYYRPFHYLTNPVLGLLSNRVKKSDNQVEACHYSHILYLELHRAFSRSLPLLGDLIEALDTKATRAPRKESRSSLAESIVRHV